jgi:glycosyltransferase involved in cell wall biosynthesis
MTPRDRIDAYLRAELAREERVVDPRLRFVGLKAKELYWTFTRFLGLSHLHDGKWRKPPDEEALKLCETLVGDIPVPPPQGRLLIDMTATHRYALKTGVQRVVRELARNCVETGLGLPFYLEDGRLFGHYRHDNLPGEIQIASRDRIFLLDSGWGFWREYPPMIDAAHDAGAEVVGALYDLIPLHYPDAVQHANGEAFKPWFEQVLLKCDAVACISRAVADEFVDWLRAHRVAPPANMQLGWFPLGADFRAQKSLAPSRQAQAIATDQTPYFLSVGTIEPRKAYPVALAAFEKLWAEGCDAHYVIVGRPGWKTAVLQKTLRRHPEHGRRLFWLADASDDDLHLLYRHARALVFPSFVEGFGMPLVEAAHHGVETIASDIPVFREVGGDRVRYFSMLDSDDLARAIRETMMTAVRPSSPSTIGWRESATTVAHMIMNSGYQIDAGRLRERIQN